MKFRAMPIVLALFPLAALAAPAPAGLQTGLWQFQYHTTAEMEGHAMPAMDKTGEHCVTEADPAKLPLMPTLPPNVQCTSPQLQSSDKGYHVTMSCTAAVAHGMVSQLDEDFMISPADDGNRLAIEGTVHQRITGSPVPIPAAIVKISAHAHRIGACPAGKP